MNMEKIGDLRRDEKFSRKTVKGFTLIEMLIVIAIIGILAAITSVVVSGFVRDSTFESCNNKAQLTYTAMQNALIQSEIQQDITAFDAYAIDNDSTKNGGTAPSYVAFLIIMNNGELDPSTDVTVNSYYGNSTAVSAEITPTDVWNYSENKVKSGLTGEVLNQAHAFKFLKNYFENNLSAEFTGTLQIFVDYENYTVDAVVYNEQLNHEITYLDKYYITGSSAKTNSISIMYGAEDIFAQRKKRTANGEFFGCYPLMNNLGVEDDAWSDAT